jgi:hypothetical protein
MSAPAELAQEIVDRLSKRFGVLEYFAYGHLPEHLRKVSEPFALMAWTMAARAGAPDDKPSRIAETAAGLRKLLEAKDCAVRAVLP